MKIDVKTKEKVKKILKKLSNTTKQLMKNPVVIWIALAVLDNLFSLIFEILLSRECEENSVNLNSRTAFYDKINS